MEATPLEQDVVAVATKCTSELTALEFVGEVTNTPVLVVTVIRIAVAEAPPQ
jgi:hypothetical protein